MQDKFIVNCAVHILILVLETRRIQKQLNNTKKVKIESIPAMGHAGL
jgi:hypothetical protein